MRRGRVQRVLGRGVDVDVDAPLGEHRRGQVRERDAQVAMAEVDAERGARTRGQPQQRRRAAAARALGARVDLALDDDAAVLQLADAAW